MLAVPFCRPSCDAPLSDTHDDERVVADLHFVERREQTPEIFVGVIDKAREDFLQARVDRLLVWRQIGPGLDAGIARRQFLSGGMRPIAFCRW